MQIWIVAQIQKFLRDALLKRRILEIILRTRLTAGRLPTMWDESMVYLEYLWDTFAFWPPAAPPPSRVAGQGHLAGALYTGIHGEWQAPIAHSLAPAIPASIARRRIHTFTLV